MLLTQTNTNWLRMPARELGSSFEASDGARGVGTSLLKRHKVLPHPREERSFTYPLAPAAKPRDLVVDTTNSSVAGSETSSPKTLKHASRRIGAPGLPPTPPTHSRQSSGSYRSVTTAPNFDLASLGSLGDIPSVPSTPPNQNSPPTPDVTPPRAIPPNMRPRLNECQITHSSRADSFKTAPEDPCSSDEDEVSTVRPVLPSARGSAVSVLRVAKRTRRRAEVGLGLGLESDNEGTSTPIQNVGGSQEEFVVFDGEWGSSGDTSEVERVWDDNLMRNVTVRKRPAHERLHMFDGSNAEVLEDDIVHPTMATKVLRNLPLPERIARSRLLRDNDRTPTETSERVVLPSAVFADPESPTAPDVRRFSTVSARSVSSTVVEAMVVDAPPMRQKTLRHSKKQLGLRNFSPESTSVRSTRNSSAPSSIVSSIHAHRLHHTSQRIPEQRHRSAVSNVTVSTTSSSGKSRKSVIKSGGIPVVVIPDRSSSHKSSKPPSLRSTSSRRTKRSISLNSAPLSQSSRYNEPGYFDVLPRRKQTMSEVDSVRTIDFPPQVPARRSSLSASTSVPTSRNTSRAASLTTESLKAHDMMVQPKKQPIAPDEEHVQFQEPSAGSERDHAFHSRLHVDHNGDPFFGKRMSAQPTPFSQVSYDTAGTAAEVSEAQAVSIFPHQNRSVLVVQHERNGSDPLPPTFIPTTTSQALPPTMTLNGEAATGPDTPPQPPHPMDTIDSPLRNPRAPPEPPVIKFIPPTPASLTESQEAERQLGYAIDDRFIASDGKPKKSQSFMRRAFSGRRNSESSMQFPALLKRTFSLGGRRKDESIQTSSTEGALYPTVEDRPADISKLHPFWRPAHFWDDLEDHQDSDDDEFGGYPRIDNRPKPQRSLSQKLKRTFAILPINDDDDYEERCPTDRRAIKRTPSGHMRVVKQRSQSTLRREPNGRRLYVEKRPLTDEGPAPGQFGYGFKDGNGGRLHTIPGLGFSIEYVGWSGLRRRMSERKRMQRSERLRAIISGPRAVNDGVDDVLRRRNTIPRKPVFV